MKQEALGRSLKFLKDWLQFTYDNSLLTGFTVAVGHKGKVLFNESYGYANLESKTKLTPEHIFRIASHSKTFTATALMQLQEQGKLKIDDPAADYLPWLKIHKDKRWQKVTIKQLMCHGAGMIRDGVDSDYWQLHREFPSKEQFVKEVLESDLVFEYSNRLKYSNYGYTLLGLVVEAVSGQEYNDFVTQNIVQKLGLKNTGPELEGKIINRLVTGYGRLDYNRKRLPIAQINTHGASPATGFYSTSEDLIKYFNAHMLGSKQLLTGKSKRQMQRAQLSSENSDEKSEYGLGFEIEHVNKMKLIGHGGGFPGHQTKSLFDPKTGLIVIVLTNCLRSYAGGINHSIFKVLDYFQQNWESPAASLRKYEGRYMNMWGDSEIIATGKKLLNAPSGTWDPFANPEELEYLSNDEFKIVKTDSFESPGETVKFKFDKNSKVQSVRIGGESKLPEKVYLEKMSKLKKIGNDRT